MMFEFQLVRLIMQCILIILYFLGIIVLRLNGPGGRLILGYL